jgi:hypothetical protein
MNTFVVLNKVLRTIQNTQNSVNWLVKCTLKYSEQFCITEFAKIVRNEIMVQCTKQNAMIPFYRLTGRFKSIKGILTKVDYKPILKCLIFGLHYFHPSTCFSLSGS